MGEQNGDRRAGRIKVSVRRVRTVPGGAILVYLEEETLDGLEITWVVDRRSISEECARAIEGTANAVISLGRWAPSDASGILSVS